MTDVIEAASAARRTGAVVAGRARAGVDWQATTRRAIYWGCAMCLLQGVVVRMSFAQEVSGVVVEGQTSRRVADIAVVVVSPDGRIAGTGRTNENGEFAIKLPKGGRYLLRALRMGYRPTELAFGIDDTTSVRVEFELSGINAASPQLMAPVVVRGRSVDIPARLLEVYARARHNYGSVFTRGDFALTNNFTFALGTIPGVRVNARGQILFATCDRVQVYINGTRYWTPGDSPTRVLQLVAPADVELMEVYTHVTRLPVEYLNDACAVIAVWTK